MKLLKNTYQRLATLLLILFLSSFVLPTGLSAARLLCDIGMPEMNRRAPACCELNGADQLETAISADNAPCTYQQICEQVLSKDQSTIEAIPQLTLHFTAVFVSTNLLSDSVFNESPFKRFQSGLARFGSPPPIFLLNSTFLN